MSKNKIIILLLIMLSISVVSLYTTYGLEVNNIITPGESTSDYNIISSIKESSNKQISVSSLEEKFIDISLKNTYESTIKYGMYYYLISPEKMPDNVTITLSEDSDDLLENTIKPDEVRTISIKITNNSEYSINLIIGALIGFEYGEIEDLVTDGETLIK